MEIHSHLPYQFGERPLDPQKALAPGNSCSLYKYPAGNFLAGQPPAAPYRITGVGTAYLRLERRQSFTTPQTESFPLFTFTTRHHIKSNQLAPCLEPHPQYQTSSVSVAVSAAAASTRAVTGASSAEEVAATVPEEHPVLPRQPTMPPSKAPTPTPPSPV